MKRLLTAAASLLAASLALAQSPPPSVTRLDPALDALVSPEAKVERIKGGFGFTEGPVWVQRGGEGYLLFTDIPGNVVWKLTPDGEASVYLEHVGYNGPEPWRWGGWQNNGFDKNDPRYEEFAQIGADGMTLDREGFLYVATKLGIQICDQPGRVEAIISYPQPGDASNLVFGGPDMQTLYLTDGDKVYRRHLRRKGYFPWQPLKPPVPRL